MTEIGTRPGFFFQVYMNSSSTFIPVCRLTGHGADVTRGRISADRSTVATSCAEKTLFLWDTATGSSIRSFTGHSHEVSDLAYHGSGIGIYTSCLDGHVRLFDLRAPTSAASLTFASSRNGAEDIDEFSCVTAGRSVNSALVAAGTASGHIRFFDARKASLASSAFAHYNSVCSLETSANDDIVISSSLDGTIRLWSALRGDCLMTVSDATSYTSPCVYAAFAHNDDEFIGLFLDSTARRWNVKDRIYCKAKLYGPKMTGSTKTFALLPNQGIAVPSEDGYMHFLDRDGKPTQAPTKAHADDILSVDCQDGLMVSTGAGEDSSAVLWLQPENDSELVEIKSQDYSVTYSLVSPQIEGLV
jgi:WD40 repeat protein